MKAGIYRTPNGNLIYVAKDRTIKAASLTPSSWPGTKVKTFNDGGHVWIYPDDTASRITCYRVADVPNGCTDPQKALTDYQAAAEAEIEEIFGPADPDSVEVKTIRETVNSMQRGEDPYKAAAASIYSNEDYQRAAVRATGRPATLGVGYGKDLERGTSHGKMSGGPLSSNLPRVDVSDRTEEKMARLAAASKSGVPEAWRNVENAGQYKDLQFEMERVAMQAKGFRLCHAQSARKHRRPGDTVLPSDTRPGAYWWRQASTQRTVKINVRGHVFDTPAAI